LNTTLNTTRGIRKISPENSMNLMDGNTLGKTLRPLFTKDSHFGKLALAVEGCRVPEQ
jgi:hypothetical protein